MSYLEGYGVSEARQEKRLMYGIGLVILLALAGVVFYFWQRDRTELQKIDGFLNALHQRDYKTAYSYWGCTDQTPCKEYPFNKFMEDWGPSSPYAGASTASAVGGQHCSGGRIEIVRQGSNEIQLWIQRSTQLIGFAPWPIDTDPPQSFAIRLRRMMRDIAGDCSPPAMKVP